MDRTTTTFLEGLSYGEAPRWHDGRLYWSDFFTHTVSSTDLNGNLRLEAEVPGQPSGLGWLPDGRLVVVSMQDHRLLVRGHDGSLEVLAELAPHTVYWANELLVDEHGRCYVGSFGFDLDTFLAEHGVEGIFEAADRLTTCLVLVQPDGQVEVAAEGLLFPNGTVLLEGGQVLVIAETLALQLTAFDVDGEGRLSNRRVFASLQPSLCAPDGICADAEGGIWVANSIAPEVLRVTEGGEITDRVSTSQPAFACMLGGPEGRHLFAVTAPNSIAADRRGAREGRIEVCEVEVPHAGRP